MYLKQFYLGCLAQASYLIGSDGEAAVVDPRRDVEEYVEEAARQGLSIRHVIETHLHADFVSGHRDLAGRTGAKIYFGRRARARFDHVAVGDGESLDLGRVRLTFLETPGHTPESICVVASDRSSGEPHAVFTGDTLFIGDVGRPDLAGGAGSPSELAGQLYDSLQRLLALPDSVIVYPGHGAGSLCGKNISSETQSTIGQQRRFNYALQPMPREQFVGLVTTDLPEAPAYFARDAALNREGPASLAGLAAPRPFSPQQVEDQQKLGAVVLDTRAAADYAAGHVPGSLHVGLGGQFASWAGTLLSGGSALILVAEDEEKVREARTRLARVGLEDVGGYLDGGLLAWEEAGRPLARTEQIDVQELARRLAAGEVAQLIDVRRQGEWNAGHIAQAAHVALHELEARAAELDRQCPATVICAGGYRSSIAGSVLEREGFRKVVDVVAGMAAWQAAGLETV